MKCVTVRSESQFIVGASIGILEERPWHTTTRKLTQIRDRCDRSSDVMLPAAPMDFRRALRAEPLLGPHNHHVAASGGEAAVATARRQALPLGNA
jgi:hypothetical protein